MESTITLWQLKQDPNRAGSGWFTDNNEVLGVAELREVLRAGLGRGRVVFCMTQRPSGGFHFLGVPRKVTPEIREHLAAYQRAVDGGEVTATDAGLRERAAQFSRFITRLTEQNGRVKELLLTGTRADLEKTMGPAATRPGIPGASNRRAPREDLQKAWN
jgi:hypothetical protein